MPHGDIYLEITIGSVGIVGSNFWVFHLYIQKRVRFAGKDFFLKGISVRRKTYNGSRILGNSLVEGFELEVLIAHELVLVGSKRGRHGSACF
jgi:hypothetical protein